jgi:hypothetical protein
MDHNTRNDPSIATDGVPSRRPSRFLVVTAVAAAALAVVVVFLFRDRLLDRWRAREELDNGFPPGVLADYVPEDSEALLAANVRSLRESPSGRQLLGPSLRQLLARAERRLRWIELLGINTLEDLDTLQISFAPGAGGQPLWLARGRLDRSRIQLGPDKLQETTLDHFRVWKWSDRPNKRATLIAPVGDTLVVSDTSSRVQAALRQASDPRPPAVRDAVLRELLAKVDRRQSVWFAASVRSLGPLDGLKDLWLTMLLRPVLAHAESIRGGIDCGDELRADLHFRAASIEDADRLETSLKSIRDLAREGGWLLGGQKELRPLLRLIGSATLHRDGTSIQLRSRLPAES